MTVKKNVVPETKVSTGSVQDLINQMRGTTASSENHNITEASETSNSAAPTEPTKKGVIPKAIVSVDPEIQKMRELLSSGREAVIDSDGTISEAGDDRQTSTTKAKTVPKAIVSIETDNRNVQSIIDEMRGCANDLNKSPDSLDSTSKGRKTEEFPKKKGLVPQGTVSK